MGKKNNQFDSVRISYEAAIARKDYQSAAIYINKLMALQKHNVEFIRSAATVYWCMDDVKKAIQLAKKFVLLRPKDKDGHLLLLRLYQNESFGRGVLSEAAQVLRLCPTKAERAEAILYKTEVQIAQGGMDEECCMSLLEVSEAFDTLPDKIECYGKYLFNLHYFYGKKREEIYAAHKRYNDFFKEVARYEHKPRKKSEKIHIGYISTSFCGHVNYSWYYNLFHFHNRKKFKITCYACPPKVDAHTESIQYLVEQWRDIRDMDHAAVAELIYNDGVDILFDFDGHTKNNLLPVLARKPAPIQICGLGYFDTTGLDTVDFFLTDGFLDDAQDTETLFTERLLKLPNAHFSYTQEREVPEIMAESAYSRNGYITFGSFCKFSKVNEMVLHIWCAILNRVPGSRLLLKGRIFDEPFALQLIKERMLQLGFEEARLEFRGISHDYLNHYRDIDIALDTFPYPGGVTTCDALFMGVPVIALVGDRHGSRFGYSILKNVELDECIAFTLDEYVEKAVALANDTHSLEVLRLSLRDRMLESPLMDGVGYTRDLENLYEQIYNEYIAGVETISSCSFSESQKYTDTEEVSCNDLDSAAKKMSMFQNNKILKRRFEGCQNKFNLFFEKKEMAKAAQMMEEILIMKIPNFDIYYTAARFYWQNKDLNLAQINTQEALKLRPRDTSAHFLLLKIEKEKNNIRGILQEASYVIDNSKNTEEVCEAYVARARSYGHIGMIDKSCDDFLSAFQVALTTDKKIAVFERYIFYLHYSNQKNQSVFHAAHQIYNDLFQNVLRYQHDGLKKPERIHIGYISVSFYQHVNSFWYEQLLRYHDRSKFKVFCYSSTKENDSITNKVKNYVEVWRDISLLTHDEAAHMIYQDQVDILFDFDGHTPDSCLPVLVRKPAPIQISGLGYFATTGVKEVDYFLGDCHLDSTDEQAGFFTEEILKLANSHFCYSPRIDAPDIAVKGKSENGIVFGSFNNFSKTTDQILSLWLSILNQVNESRLVLKSSAFSDLYALDIVKKRMVGLGYQEEQFELRPASEDYLMEYADIDVALDTFPYPGGITTCEALYMGTPVITLAGERHHSRFGYSIMKNLKLEQCIAHTEAEYREKAIALARDDSARRELRLTLRDRMKVSPLMDGEGYTRELESLYERILQEQLNAPEQSLDENKICFITYQTDEVVYKNCLAAIEKLHVPEGLTVEVLSVVDAKNTAAAYNEAMQASDAKYKVYLQEDVLIENKKFIGEVIEIFREQPQIGMLGVAGTGVIPTSAICQQALKRYGKIKDRKNNKLWEWKQPEGKYAKVQAVDGNIMITQYDIPWREDLFEHDFYDVAQSIEFRRKEYESVVVSQDKPWCSFSGNIYTLDEIDRNAFLDEYSKDVYPLVTILMPTYNRPHYFKIALESALNQTYRNIEIFISDDSTNEETANLMPAYLERDKRITYFRNPELVNVLENIRFLQLLKSGDYINWLFDDDVFYEGKIAVMMDYYLQYDGITLVTSKRTLIDQDGNSLPDNISTKGICQDTTLLEGDTLGKALLENLTNFVGELSTVLIRKKYLKTEEYILYKDPKDNPASSPPFIAMGTHLIPCFIRERQKMNIIQGEDETHFGTVKIWSAAHFGDIHGGFIADVYLWLDLLSQGNAVYSTTPLSAFRVHSEQLQQKHDIQVISMFYWAEAIIYACNNRIFFKEKNECLYAVANWIEQTMSIYKTYMKNQEFDAKVPNWHKIRMERFCDILFEERNPYASNN